MPPPAPPLALRAKDVDPPVQHAAVQRDVVFLLLEREDHRSQLVVRELPGTGIGGSAPCSGGSPVPSKIGRSSDSGAGVASVPAATLAAQPRHALAAERIDARVEAPAALRDRLLLVLRPSDQAVEVVVGQAGEVGERIHGVTGTFRRRTTD